MTAVEGNASVYQLYPVSRTTGQGRTEFLRAWGPGAGGNCIYNIDFALYTKKRDDMNC